MLNSRLLDWYLQQITTRFHSGWFAYNKQFIEQVPIRLPKSAAEVKCAERITRSVHAIMVAKASLRAGSRGTSLVDSARRGPVLSDRELNQLEATVETHEKRIDQAVFALYGVEGLPSG